MLNAMPEIHLISSFSSNVGGSAWRALHIFELLEQTAQCKVYLWSTEVPSPELKAKYPINQIELKKLKFPKTGTFVFVGIYFHIGKWFLFTKPNRISLTYNTVNKQDFLSQKHKLEKKAPLDLAYASPYMQKNAGFGGVIEPSPINLNQFCPIKQNNNTAFTIGRLSRDVLSKHHKGDLDFYNHLCELGYRVRIMGGTCLKEYGQPHSRLDLLPSSSIPAHHFIQSLDYFFFRSQRTEAHGRVITEAMACGIPVVCHQKGGYTDFIIKDKENGFIFEKEQDALHIIEQLKNNTVLRNTIGQKAREDMENYFSKEFVNNICNYYINGQHY